MYFTESNPSPRTKFIPDGKSILLFIPLVCLFLSNFVSAQDETTAKLEAFEKRLASLEQENTILRDRISKLEKAGTEAIAEQVTGLVPKDETEKKAFFDKFRIEFQSSQDQALGPWTTPEPWTKIRKRMSEYSVREILGRPTRIRPSVKPYVEVVYFYKGDLNSDGEDETGYVELKDKRVVSFKSPHTSE